MALKTKTTSLLQISLLTWLPSDDLHLCDHQGLSVLTPEATLIPRYSFLLRTPSWAPWNTWAPSMQPEFGALSSTAPSSSLSYSIDDQIQLIRPSQ